MELDAWLVFGGFSAIAGLLLWLAWEGIFK